MRRLNIAGVSKTVQDFGGGSSSAYLGILRTGYQSGRFYQNYTKSPSWEMSYIYTFNTGSATRIPV